MVDRSEVYLDARDHGKSIYHGVCMTNKLKLEVGRTYVTRKGHKARVVALDANNTQPVVVILDAGAYEEAEHYSLDGRYFPDETSMNDLVEEYNAWANVPVDAKIRVKLQPSDPWEHRHFARVDCLTGRVRAWEWGRTSHTIGAGATSAWEIAELVE